MKRSGDWSTFSEGSRAEAEGAADLSTRLATLLPRASRFCASSGLDTSCTTLKRPCTAEPLSHSQPGPQLRGGIRSSIVHMIVPDRYLR